MWVDASFFIVCMSISDPFTIPYAFQEQKMFRVLLEALCIATKTFPFTSLNVSAQVYLQHRHIQYAVYMSSALRCC